MSDPISMARIGRVFLLMAVLAALLMAAPLCQPALADGGDVSMDFIAAAPFTYDHLTGGGAYNNRGIGKTNDVVESLETGDFLCDDIVTYFVAISVVDTPVDALQTLEMDFSFLASTTGQQGVAHTDIVNVLVNYGVVQNGKGTGGTDAGMIDDGGSTATLVSEAIVDGPPFMKKATLVGTIQVDDLEASEQVILRIDVRFQCDIDPNKPPTGNLQANLNAARIVDPIPVDTVPGGEQTIPFKVTEAPEICEVLIDKTTNGGDGLCIPAGSQVEWTYVVTNNSNVAVTYVVTDNELGEVCSGSLAVGEITTCTATGTAQAGDYTNSATVVVTTPAGSTCEATDTSGYFGAEPAIDIVKTTNGEDDPCIPEDDPITWTYVVTNTGNVPLSNVVVTDDQGVAVSCPATELAVGASMTCTATGVAQAGNYSNLGMVSADYQCEAQVLTVSDDDPSGYFGATCSIDIDKTTNGGDGVYIAVGETVTWTYVVTNNGNVPVLATVTDSMIAAPIAVDFPIAAGGIATFTATDTAEPGLYENEATVTATNDCGGQCSAEDPSSYFGATCDIDIDKTTNGGDGLCIPAGSAVEWMYVVTNNGNVAVTYAVEDSDLGPICSGTLDAGQSATCTASGTAQVGQYDNLATVTATNECGDKCSDEDPSGYFGAEPAIDIVKTTNGEDDPCIPEGDPITWTYVVTNTGNVPLSNVVVTDDQGVAVSCPQTTLDIGESMTCTATGVAQAGDYSNMGMVSADYQCQDQVLTVSDDDPSGYFGATCSIDIDKTTNGGDGLCILAGSAVEWMYVVTNNGNVAVTYAVEDSDLGPICSGTLDAGQSVTCTAAGTAQPGLYDNLATVTATNECGDKCSAEDPSSYFGAEPAIDIVKTTNGEDNPCLLVGGEVIWTYTVTNIGNVPVSNVIVTDDQGVAVSCPATELAVGESMICTAAGVVAEGDYSNLATVTAEHQCGDQILVVQDEDPSGYFGATCDVDIEKSTNGEDADEAPGPEIPVGDPVTWTYVITNNGNVPVLATVTDNMTADPIAVDVPLAANGGTATFTASGTAEEGLYENLATVTATNECGGECSDSDPSHYTGVSLFQGCTPGYWKQEHHFDSWIPTGYSPDDLVGDVFAAAPGDLAGDSLVEALDYPGGPGLSGASRILLRAGVAGLLNAGHPDLAYEIADPGDVIDAVNEALASGNRGKMLELAGKLDGYNNAGCFDDMEEEPVPTETSSPAPQAPRMKTAVGPANPNPFNPDTWIPFRLAEDANVKIEIYDVTGRLVRRLDLGYRPAGSYWDRSKSAYWDGRNEAGEYVSSGIYFYKMTAGDFTAIRRMVILK